jgi:hypothetical protein
LTTTLASAIDSGEELIYVRLEQAPAAEELE